MQLAGIPSALHPADYPSRELVSCQPVTPLVLKQLQFLEYYPGYINLDPLQPLPPVDSSSDAWSTPVHIRQLLHRSKFPPTFDLYADPTTTLAPQYHHAADPCSGTTLQSDHVLFFQPPYRMLATAWAQVQPHLPTTSGLWGLVPSSFFQSHIATSPLHICYSHSQINYNHPTHHTQSMAGFTSCLFFIPPHPHQCLCAFIHHSLHTV